MLGSDEAGQVNSCGDSALQRFIVVGEAELRKKWVQFWVGLTFAPTLCAPKGMLPILKIVFILLELADTLALTFP